MYPSADAHYQQANSFIFVLYSFFDDLLHPLLFETS